MYYKVLWIFYQLNLLTQPKVIKSTSKYLGMIQRGKLSQLLSETLKFKGSLNIPKFQGSNFFECDRIRVLNLKVQRDYYSSQLLDNAANRKKCDVSVAKVKVQINLTILLKILEKIQIQPDLNVVNLLLNIGLAEISEIWRSKLQSVIFSTMLAFLKKESVLIQSISLCHLGLYEFI